MNGMAWEKDVSWDIETSNSALLLEERGIQSIANSTGQVTAGQFISMGETENAQRFFLS